MNSRLRRRALGLALAGGVLCGIAAPAETRAEGSPYGNYLAGVIAGNHQNFGRASDFLLAALEENPGSPELAVNAFVMLAADGRLDIAKELAPTVLEIVPQHLIASLVMSVQAFERGELEEADAQLAALPQRGAASLLAPLARGWIAVDDDSLDALAERLRPLEENPSLQGVVPIHKALMYDVAGAAEQAGAAYDAALETAQNPTFRLILLAGNFFERQGEREKALDLYRGFLESRPGVEVASDLILRAESGEVPDPIIATSAEGMAEVYFDVGTLLSQEGARDMALVHARLALDLRPNFNEAVILVGETLQGLQRHEAAIEAYRSVGQDSAFLWNVGLRIADELDELGQTEAAIAELERLAAEQPERFEPYFRIGNLQRESERFAEAAEAYDEAVRRVEEPQGYHWSLFYFRGIAYERSDAWQKAEADFLRALELRPEDPYVMNYLAYSWVEQHSNLERAQEMLVRAVELRPDDGYIVDSLGWVYYRLGKYQPAVERLERAVELQPQDPTINDHLGDAYWRTGRTREARVQWQRALSLEPEADLVPKIEKKLSEGMPPPEEYDYIPKTENETPALSGKPETEGNDI
ncbi:MAG: tetratricopeptide repeat protein [Rhodovibrionaceae bacterium]